MGRWGFHFGYVLPNIKTSLPACPELSTLHLTADIATDKYATTNLVTLLFIDSQKTQITQVRKPELLPNSCKWRAERKDFVPEGDRNY